jgi:hypothetical protein
MIVIWRGIGGLVVLIGILTCLVMNIVTSAVFNQTNYFQEYLWPKLAALWLAGVSCWFLGRYVNGKPPKAVIDERTGQHVEVKPIHDLMFIKMEYWGVIYGVIGLVLLVFSFTRN